MKRIIIDDFGKGLDTTSNSTLVKQGYARISQNLLHNQGDNRVELRRGIDRTYTTRPSNNIVNGLYEYINNSGTSFRLNQIGGSLRAATTEIDSGHQSTAISQFAQALNFWLEADARSNNYIGNGTNGYPFQIIAPTAVPTSSFPAAGVLTGSYRYTYAYYSSITGEISPAYSSYITVVPAGQTVRFAINLAVTEQFDQIRIYRTRASGVQFYELTTQNTAVPMSYDDNNSDSTLTTVSTIHNSAGASITDRPVAATDVVFHRGRIHEVGLSGARSRHRWSQPNSFSFENTTDARHNVESDDGDFLWRAFSMDGALVLFKDHSIHIMNGDVDELSFTWQVASDKNTGIGSYCPFTAVNTPNGIIFQGENGVYLFRPGMLRPQLISSNIRDSLDGLDYSRRELFVAGFDLIEQAYILSVTPNGQTLNTESYAYFINTGYWSRWIYGMGNIRPSAWASMHNSTSRIKAYLGDSNGYVYETNTGTGNDGVTSGTETNTATGGSATTVQDTNAAFNTSGDGLRGISATVQTGTSSFESQEISSNTATILTTSVWTTTPVSGNTYYVGAIEGVLSLGRFDCGTTGNKRFIRINFEFQSQTHSIPLLLGYTLDGDSQPTSVNSVTQVGVFRSSIIINRIGIGLSPYVRIVGTDNTFEILKIEMDYHDLPGRLS